MTTSEQVGLFLGAAIGGLVAWLVVSWLGITAVHPVTGIGAILGFVGAHAGYELAARRGERT